jgi:hypothetical protein
MSFEKNKEFESELKGIRPTRPSQKVLQDIEREIRKSEDRTRLIRWKNWSVWGGLAVAASVLVAFGFSLLNPQMDSMEPTSVGDPEPLVVNGSGVQVDESDFKPVLAQNNLRDRVDEGIVFLKNGVTARKYRYEFVDKVVWRNPSDGAVIEMEVPRDEVVLIPVQTF